MKQILFASALALTLASPLSSPAQAKETLTASVSPNKQGTITVGAPTTFRIKMTTTDTKPDLSGGHQLKSIAVSLPPSLLFNPLPFSYCDVDDFIDTHECPSSTKLGTATIVADGGPDVGRIVAHSTFYFGTGYAFLARVQTDQPAVIDQAIVGSLQSSGIRGYGLQMYLPVPLVLRSPLPGIYPTVRSIKAVITPPTKTVLVRGRRTVIPLAGLGPCKRLPFLAQVMYSDNADFITHEDIAKDTVSCR